MAKSLAAATGRFLYGVAFCVCLPVLLVAWAVTTRDLFKIPSIYDPVGGGILCCSGVLLMVWGMAALWIRGGGLPMNAYPPPRFVATGIYAVLPHPIYAGFCLLCIGVSIATPSASGFWLVSPAVMLGSTALVLGYEEPSLRKRFGDMARAPSSWLPADDCEVPSLGDAVRFGVMVLLPWLALFEAIQALGVQPGSVNLRFPFERRLPTSEWTVFIYASTYVAVVSAPFLVATRRQLRQLWLRAAAAMLLVFPVYVLLPSVAPRPPFVPATWAGFLIDWERSANAPTAAFPSFHVIWSFLAAEAIGSRWPKTLWLCRVWAAGVAVACVTTGLHSVADVLAGALIAVLLIKLPRVWAFLRQGTERIANSWREWRMGPVRIINHGFYAGAGTFVAYSIVGAVVGPGGEPAVAVTAIAALCGAGLWAQWIEGSPRLLRPYGFYGGVAGVIIASLIASGLFQVSAWLLMAAHCIAAPWLQSIGRLRCLVQGCCHGAPAPENAGIRYTHPKSRVVRVANLGGVPVYPTQLYSIFWNVLVALVLMRFWSLGAALHLVGGVYLILTGAGRFVEEAYRGEPQTPIFAGLRLYQWVGVATVIAGAIITAVFSSGPAPALRFAWPEAATAAVLGVIATAALGVDFPSSNRRFARLT